MNSRLVENFLKALECLRLGHFGIFKEVKTRYFIIFYFSVDSQPYIEIHKLFFSVVSLLYESPRMSLYLWLPALKQQQQKTFLIKFLSLALQTQHLPYLLQT